MNTIVPRSLWIVPTIVLVLFGTGCLSPSEPIPAPIPAVPVANNVKPTPTPTPTPTPAPTPAPMLPPTDYNLPTIDTTWNTYTNKAETFSFQWPTRGRLAPTWEVMLPKSLTDGCYTNSMLGTPVATTKLVVGDQTFCHVQQGDAGMHQRYFNDYFATIVDGQNIVIAFEKHLVVGEVMGDGTCKGLVLPSSTEASCQKVDVDAYRAHLDQIVGTFTVMK